MQWASVHFKNSELQWSALHCILIDGTEVLEQRLEELTRCSAAVQYFHRGAWVVGAGGLVISDQVTKGPTIPPNLRLYFRPSKKLKLKLIISVKVSNECKKGGQRHFFLPSKCWVGIRPDQTISTCSESVWIKPSKWIKQQRKQANVVTEMKIRPTIVWEEL